MTDDLRDRLEQLPIPGAREAESRAWDAVRGVAAAAPSRRRRRRRTVAAVLLAVAGATAAATAPGAAVADWVRARVDPPPARTEPPVVPAHRLPAPGQLLIRDDHGLALIREDGTRRRLGAYAGAAWSPRGLFIVAWRGDRLSALTPAGAVRWQITAPRRIRAARWSPDGFRVAYLTTGGDLRVVAGDGTGDHRFARAADVVPAWRPGTEHTLAYVARAGRVRVRDVDSFRPTRVPGAAAPMTRTLAWSGGGRLLTAVGSRERRTFDLRRHRQRRASLQMPGRYGDAAFAPTHPTLAVIVRSRDGSLVRAGRELFATRGNVARAIWSPDGRWLLLEVRDANQLIAARVTGPPRVLSFPGGRLQDWSR